MKVEFVSANIDRFSGFAVVYDSYRPAPPAAIADLLVQLAGSDTPSRVVDIASGTGLSTLIWSGRAAEVIGIEPNVDMRAEAERRAAAANTAIRFREGLSTATGLGDGCADIVTVSQALHWMEPEPTFAEIARILRPGGVFAAYDCDWPPTLNWEAEQAYARCLARAAEVERERGYTKGVHKWGKSGHRERIAKSGRFRHMTEVVMHSIESGGAERLVGVALSQGVIESSLRRGVSEDEVGITDLRSELRAILGDSIVPWYWSYRVRIGIK